MFGRDIVTALTQLQPQPAEETPSNTRGYNSPREISVGQSVFIRNFVGSPAWIEGTVMERLGHRSWMIKCETGTFRRHLDHIKPGVEKSQAEARMASEHGEQRETTRQDTVPAPYMLDPSADSTVSSGYSLTEEPAPQEPVTQPDTTTASRPQRHRQPPDRYGDSI
ncbi:hypothetical protein MTO96_012030 [Rhipicephalus appendiculatus]